MSRGTGGPDAGPAASAGRVARMNLLLIEWDAESAAVRADDLRKVGHDVSTECRDGAQAAATIRQACPDAVTLSWRPGPPTPGRPPARWLAGWVPASSSWTATKPPSAGRRGLPRRRPSRPPTPSSMCSTHSSTIEMCRRQIMGSNHYPTRHRWPNTMAATGWEWIRWTEVPYDHHDDRRSVHMLAHPEYRDSQVQ